jgi:hypothetical protein
MPTRRRRMLLRAGSGCFGGRAPPAGPLRARPRQPSGDRSSRVSRCQRLTGGRQRSSATWTRTRRRLPWPVLHLRRGCRYVARAGQVLRSPGSVAGLAGSSPRHPSAGGWGAHLAAAGPGSRASVVRSPPPRHDARSRRPVSCFVRRVEHASVGGPTWRCRQGQRQRPRCPGWRTSAAAGHGTAWLGCLPRSAGTACLACPARGSRGPRLWRRRSRDSRSQSPRSRGPRRG